MLVGIFGIDGSGKTTQLQLLAEALRKLGRAAEVPSAVSHSRLAAHRIAWVNGHQTAYDVFDAHALLLSGALDIAQQAQSWSLARDCTVLVDEYTDCFKAHSAVRGWRDFGQAELVFAHLPRPDLTFFLGIDADTAYRRIVARDGARYPNHTPTYLARYREEYEHLVSLDPRVRVLDASKSAESVHRSILASVLAPDDAPDPLRKKGES